MKQIKSLEELKQCAIDKHNYCIHLSYGEKSSKWIEYHKPPEDRFYVYNYIDDTDGKYTEQQLKDETIIVDAIFLGKLYMEN